ncbi:MAG TPA: thiamine diphosphokinase [Candidatus Onthomonas avicola]|nr:thiamine diphosphokinase [Candidatus Onthomonas avicola]
MGGQVTGRAILIGAADDGTRLDYLKRQLRPNDFLICADGGRNLAERSGLRPDWYVGDNDSGGRPDRLPSTLLPPEKDVTDLEMAVHQALALGYREMLLAACTGGRADHHLANLGLLEEISRLGAQGTLVDPYNEIRFLTPGHYRVENVPFYRYLSLIPLDEEIAGVTLSGVKYELQNAVLRRGSTLSVSNEILDGHCAEISISTGRVYLIRSNPTSR